MDKHWEKTIAVGEERQSSTTGKSINVDEPNQLTTPNKSGGSGKAVKVAQEPPIMIMTKTEEGRMPVPRKVEILTFDGENVDS